MPSEDINGTIDGLKAVIAARSGLARPTQFKTIFTLPPALSAPEGRDLTILCQTSSLPTRTVTSTDYDGTQRHAFKIPNGYTYEDITLTFLLAADFYPKDIFDKWLNLTIDPITYRARYSAEYSSVIQIHQLDMAGNSIYGVRLNRAWPTSMSPIELSSEMTDTVHKLSVTFSYYDLDVMPMPRADK